MLVLSVIYALLGAIVHGATIKRTTQRPWELLEAVSATSQLSGFNGTWITDDDFYYMAADHSIQKYNAITDNVTELVSSTYLSGYKGATFTLSPDNTNVLLRHEEEDIFRYSSIAKYDIFNIKTRSSRPIHDGTKLQYCTWSPVKDRLSYVYKNNVYVHFEGGTRSQLTRDGVVGVIYNGVPDWVYEEEVVNSNNAMWWSPDGVKLAAGFYNDTNVHNYGYSIYSGSGDDDQYQYPKQISLKYPKPGTPNPTVAVKVFDLSCPNICSVVLTAPTSIVTDDHILETVTWVNNGSVLVVWLNRRQNLATLQLCFLDGSCHEVKRIVESDGWITLHSPVCLTTRNSCHFIYWIGNWQQVWSLNLDTGVNERPAAGNFTVIKIYGYKEAEGILYYRATLPRDPSIYHVFSNDNCLTCNLRDDNGTACLSAEASFSKNFSHYVVQCLGPYPRDVKVMVTKTNSVRRSWESNAFFREKYATKLRPNIKILDVPLADGSRGLAQLYLPPNLDESKKYSMIVNVYGGPDTVRVTNSFNVGYGAYLTTKHNVIYAYIDGRGSGNKGKGILFSVNNHLGVHEVADQLYVTKYLRDHLPYIHPQRIGIWGWSYGGYVAARVLAHDTDGVFQCGVSVAPVTSWLLYDTIYTERYMGLPKDNYANYNDSSVLKNVKNFGSHNLLLIHGTADDNVHYQHFLLFTKALQRRGIHFEEMTYADESHSIGNFFSHLYNTMDIFWSTSCKQRK